MHAEGAAGRTSREARAGRGLFSALRGASGLATSNPAVTGFMRFRLQSSGGAEPLPELSWTRLEAVSPYMIAAVVGAEDPPFFRHHGVAWAYVWRALVDAAHGQPLRGASSITQQLARNLFLTPERLVARKLKELVLACRLEQTLTKVRILELYLNVIEWGVGVWGITAAAQVYFARRPAQLGAFEAAVLTSLLPAPRRPLEGPNLRRALIAQHTVVNRLRVAGIITPAGAEAALSRARTLGRALAAGAPASETMSRLAGWDVPGEASEPAAPTLEEVLAGECGLRRILQVRRQQRAR